jgi:acyl-CoA synthetase (AMP-forming)/AMP-acid ligase II
VHWAGGTVSPANPLYTVEELAMQLKDSKASVIVTQKPFLPVATEAARKAGVGEERIVLLGDAKDENGSFKHWTEFRDKSLLGTRKPRVDAKDLSFVVYSSVSRKRSWAGAALT